MVRKRYAYPQGASPTDQPTDISQLTPTYHFYVRDHLGNNRLIVDENGMIEQVNHYYPFGGLMGESQNFTSTQRYKYNGKELDRMHGLDWYDYGARHYDGSIGRWMCVDPLAEKYHGISPYAYCGNNPVTFIDLDGKDWYKTNDNWLIWNPKVHSQKDLQDGYTYVGKSYYDYTNGVSYRDDGSILFSDETMAYKRMWYMSDTHWRSKKYPEGKEESAFLLENKKVLVMPDNWNDSQTSLMIGYTRKSGILYSSKGEAFRFVGQVHTHQGGGDKGLSQAGDVNDISFAKKQPGKPVIIFHKNGYIYGGVYTDRLHSWHNDSKLEDVSNVLNGNLSLFDIVNFMITK